MWGKGSPDMDKKLDEELEQLEKMTLRKLRCTWKSRLGEEPPALRSGETLRHLLAYIIQEKARGGLSIATQKRLRKLAGSLGPKFTSEFSFEPSLKPGTILTREWQGRLFQVRVLEDGFEYEGERLTSLSEAARKITGTRWSGPLFFGLKK